MVRTLGRNGFAGEDGFHGGGLTDRSRQTEESAGTGDQVALHFGQAER